MSSGNLLIASDHAGFILKTKIIKSISKNNQNLFIKDLGCDSADSCDYPDYASSLAKLIQDGRYKHGILLCGSANGMAIVANKYSRVRAALAWLPEIAQLAREHNDANIICLPARYLTLEQALIIVDNFLNTEFMGGRHANRVNKILNLSC